MYIHVETILPCKAPVKPFSVWSASPLRTSDRRVCDPFGLLRGRNPIQHIPLNCLQVEFYNGAALIGTVTSVPYMFNWANVPASSYSVTAVATDNFGATTISAPVTVMISASELVFAAPVKKYSTNDYCIRQGIYAVTEVGCSYQRDNNQ